MTNVVAKGLQNIITPFEYDPVLRDLKAVWPLLADHAILIGDDHYWGRVKEAAHEFAASVGAPLVEEAGKFIISKGKWSPSLG